MAQPSKEKTKLADSLNNGQIADRQAAITSPSGGGTQDTEARTAIDSIISTLEAHGLVDDN